MRKSLLEEVQELEARSVDPGAAVLRDASSRRYRNATKHLGISHHTYTSFYHQVDFSKIEFALCYLVPNFCSFNNGLLVSLLYFFMCENKLFLSPLWQRPQG